MDQFCLVNLDACVALELGKLVEGLRYAGLHEHLAPRAVGRNLINLEELRHKLTGSLPRFDAQRASRLLTVLPADVIRHIFDCFGDTEVESARIDAARLALTCQMCFAIGHSVLKRHNAPLQSWAGHRLIIAGQEQDIGDLPAGLQLPDLWAAESIYDASGAFPEPRLEHLREAVVTAVIKPMYRFARWQREVAAADRLARLWGAMFAAGDAGHEDARDLVLRNLSKKEYVRADVLAAEQERCYEFGYCDMPEFTTLRVGDLAAFRICWTSDASTSLEGVPPAGPWAGDRFDIVSAPQAYPAGWKDVSESLVRNVARVYSKYDW